MKVFINGYSIKEYVVADIDNIVTNTEFYYDGYVCEDRAVDIRQIKNIISAIENLGSKVKRITIKNHIYCDLDTKYYKRFPDNIIDKLWERIGSTWGIETEVYIKGNRIYTNVDGYEIVLPKEMYDDYDNKTLRLKFYV